MLLKGGSTRLNRLPAESHTGQASTHALFLPRSIVTAAPPPPPFSVTKYDPVRGERRIISLSSCMAGPAAGWAPGALQLAQGRQQSLCLPL